MIISLLIILFVLMLLVGGNRGLDSFFVLIRTVLVMVLHIYFIAWGFPVILTTVVMCVLCVVIVIYMQNGWNAKMHAAACSVGIVLCMVCLVAGPFLVRAGSSGYNEIEQYEEISMYLSENISVSMSAVVLSSLLLGLLGAIMDTAVAVTTAMHEIDRNEPGLSERQLLQSGLSVGKDILGTTINTLFFAGLGECIMLAVLFMKNEDSFFVIINSKALFQEMSGLLLGMIGCCFIIPISSVMGMIFLKKLRKIDKK